MRYVVLATHGKMAEGLKHTIEWILGPRPSLSAYSVENDLEGISAALKQFFDGLETSDQVLVFTDISQGSTTQLFYPYLKTHQMHLIAGGNLALILSLMLYPDDQPLTEAQIREEIQMARAHMHYVNDSEIIINEADEL